MDRIEGKGRVILSGRICQFFFNRNIMRMFYTGLGAKHFEQVEFCREYNTTPAESLSLACTVMETSRIMV